MIVTLLIFLVVLLILVLVHEVGHAIAARASGCRVDEFGVGFPPRLRAFKVGETTFSLNALPLGGFVRLAGEDEDSDDPRSYTAQPRYRRAIILLGGVIGNLFLAVGMFTLLFGIGFDISLDRNIPGTTNPRVLVLEVKPDSPAARAGIQAGDLIRVVNDIPVASASEAATAIKATLGDELRVRVERNSQTKDLVVHGFSTTPEGKVIGVGLAGLGTVRVSWLRAPLEGFKHTIRVLKATGHGFVLLVKQALESGTVPGDVAGPVGIAALTGTIARQGALPLVEFSGVLSVNLAVVNILPIPALDGGRLLFLLLDVVGVRFFRGRRERLAHRLGFAFLLALLTVITLSDIQRFFR